MPFWGRETNPILGMPVCKMSRFCNLRRKCTPICETRIAFCNAHMRFLQFARGSVGIGMEPPRMH